MKMTLEDIVKKALIGKEITLLKCSETLVATGEVTKVKVYPFDNEYPLYEQVRKKYGENTLIIAKSEWVKDIITNVTIDTYYGSDDCDLYSSSFCVYTENSGVISHGFEDLMEIKE